MTDFTTTEGAISSATERKLKIREYLYRCGVRPHLRGFKALEVAIGLCLDDSGYLVAICKRLYPAVAATVGITAVAVERDIRHAISRASDCCCNLSQVVGFPWDFNRETYTNAQFISGAVVNLGGEL